MVTYNRNKEREEMIGYPALKSDGDQRRKQRREKEKTAKVNHGCCALYSEETLCFLSWISGATKGKQTQEAAKDRVVRTTIRRVDGRRGAKK